MTRTRLDLPHLIVAAAASALPPSEARLYRETWLSDLHHCERAGVSRRSIAIGAVGFVFRRGPQLWGSTRWLRIAAALLAVAAAVALLPLLLMLALFLLSGIVALVAWAFRATEPPETSRK